MQREAGRNTEGRRGHAAAAILALVLLAPLPADAQMDTTATAQALAEAMGIPASLIVSATLLSKGSAAADPNAAAVHTGALGGFSVREGSTFAVLTSGSVGLIAGANDVPGAGYDQGTVDGRGAEAGGDDIVTLKVVIDPPDTAGHLSFDHVFLSEEYPEFVGSSFNDFLIVEAGSTAIIYDTSSGAAKISSAYNVVYDNHGQIISINNNFFKDNPDQTTGTQFDGWTPLLTTCVPISDPTRMTLYFTVADVGDAAYMSAVFLDNMQFHSEQISGPITFKTLSEELLGVSGSQKLDMFTYPNPFLPGSGGRMTFELTTNSCHLLGAGNGIASLEILDISGRRIITLPGGNATRAQWDGRNGQGHLVASGMYIYTAISNTGRRGSGRFTIVR